MKTKYFAIRTGRWLGLRDTLREACDDYRTAGTSPLSSYDKAIISEALESTTAPAGTGNILVLALGGIYKVEEA